MPETAPTKVCPLCAETIKAAAKICPFCRSKQGRHAFLRQELLIAAPAIAFVIVAIVVTIMILAQFAPSEDGTGGRNFARHRSDLAVLGTALDRSGTPPKYWMTGMVTNQGAYPWRVNELEIRFLDDHGNLLDVQNPGVKDSFVVQPGHETGFRVQLGELAFTNNNVTHQVRVQLATDGDQPVKSD